MKKYKNLIILVLAVLFVHPVFSQDLFKNLTENYADKDGFSATLLTNDMFDLYLRKKNIEKDSPVYEMLENLDNILVASQNNFNSEDESNLAAIHDEIISNYKKGNYTLLKTEKKMGEDIKVYLKKADNIISSLALVTASESSVNLVEMNGNIDLTILGELSEVMNLRGLEALYKVNNNSRYLGWDGDLTLPELNSNGWVIGEYDLNDFSSGDFFTGQSLKELHERIDQQNYLSQEQKELLEQRAEEFSQQQIELAEKYRQMAEQYGRNPIYLTYPGEKGSKYIIDNKEANADDIKKLDKNDIEDIKISKLKDGEGYEIRITTKK